MTENSAVVMVIEHLYNIGEWMPNVDGSCETYAVVRGNEYVVPCIVLYKELNRGEIVWSSGGGMRDAKDQDIIETALRELEEETYVKLPRSKLKLDESNIYKKCRIWITELSDIKRSEFIRIRYETSGLKREQKEMQDLTKVPLRNLISSIDNNTRTTTDILGNKILLRYSQFKCISENKNIYNIIKSYI